ncbi:hypothetical protein N7509_005249 [Penicillium cosmopolitanum]|uniref:Tim44-like domain-containing protein n=1 Tax=Penicillium cosmopolitanum TaxID=1131564 RepID=A0A9W9W284_9EURO|nr:uncharacterized protein N7509_005249 [Penicillium cosmopolitanum]KAJ5397136.1 hypothetical protein N7509_005249 [Penicillium cosmopolitanum]
MASSLRSPAGKTLSITQSALNNARPYAPGAPQCRSFSQTSQRWAFKTQNFSPRTASQPSMKVRSKDLLANQLPNDIGLLPGTFVRPLWRDLPSVFDTPRDRLQMEWTWIKAWFQNFMSLIIYTKKDNNYPLLLTERRKIATSLYKNMYTLFASGDIPKLKQITCDGLSTKLISQIEARRPTEVVTWNLIKWLRQPNTYFTGIRVLSDRATQLPEVPKSGIRQIVLRVSSRQSMTKVNTAPFQLAAKASKNVAAAQQQQQPAKEQDVTEYVVIQQLIWNGKDAGWRVWGNTKPTTMEQIWHDPSFAPGMTALERLDAMKDFMK